MNYIIIIIVIKKGSTEQNVPISSASLKNLLICPFSSFKKIAVPQETSQK